MDGHPRLVSLALRTEEAVQHFADGSGSSRWALFSARASARLARSCSRAASTSRSSASIPAAAAGRAETDFHGGAVADGGGTFAGILHRNIIECGFADAITLIVADSVTAAALADRSIDWVHLDARHDSEHLRADISAWKPKVRPGGWLSGDDYNEEKWPEVVSTVQTLLPGAQKWSASSGAGSSRG